MGKPRKGIIRFAIAGRAGLKGFRTMLDEVLDVSRDVYASMTPLVMRFNELSGKASFSPSEEDEQIIEECKEIQRRLFFLRSRVEKMIREEENA